MDYDFAARFGELCRDARIVLSVHAPIAGFMGHAERGKKLNMAVGMLDHSAGIAKAAGAEVVVFHPGFLLGRTREEAIDSVCEQLGELRTRLEKKDRGVPFGDRGDGPRARDRNARTTSSRSRGAAAGSAPCSTSRTCTRRRTERSRSVEPFAEALAKADAVLEAGRAVPHPLQRHPVREPQRDEASPLRRGNAARRAAARRARAVRAAGDGHLGVPRRRVESDDQAGATGLTGDHATAGASACARSSCACASSFRPRAWRKTASWSSAWSSAYLSPLFANASTESRSSCSASASRP